MIDEVIWWDILHGGALFSIKFIWSFVTCSKTLWQTVDGHL